MSIFFKNSLAIALVNGRNRESTLRHAAGSLIAGGVYARLTNKEEYLPAELRFKETEQFRATPTRCFKGFVARRYRMHHDAAHGLMYRSYADKDEVQPRRHRGWWMAALTVFGVLVGVQSFALLRMAQQQSDLALAVAQQLDSLPSRTNALVSTEALVGRTTLETPKKLLLGGLTPTADQGFRGDCWLFSVMGVLEDSYRRYGVERGWLDPGLYVRLSRQAFGIRVMELCREHPSILCPVQASVNGPVLWGNTTEGADERMLFFMKSLADSALPDAVCKYTDTSAGERQCDGLHETLLSNPLHFNVTALDMLYEPLDIRQALASKQKVLTIGLLMGGHCPYPCSLTWHTLTLS